MSALAQRAGAAELEAVVAAGRTALRAPASAGDVDARKVITDLADLAGDETDADRWRGLHFNAVGDQEKAFHFLERAASAGHPEGRLDLAALHLVRAEHWLAEAAEDGSPHAAATLAALREALPPNPDTVKE
jgi:TPR repeat protein